MPPSPATPFDLLTVSGLDAQTFLQAQLSSDLRALAVGQGQFSAWLNPQGRVIAFFPLFRINADTFVIALAFGRGIEIRDRLHRFVFRAKAKLGLSTEWLLGQGPSPPAGAVASLAIPSEMARYLWLSGTDPGQEALRLPSQADILDGLPFLAADRSEVFIGHALGLKRLGAISVGKGCYPGQEIVARTHFLGRNKRALCRLSGLDPEQTDRRLFAGTSAQAVGELALTVNDLGLAVLHEPEPGMALRDASERIVKLDQVFGDS